MQSSNGPQHSVKHRKYRYTCSFNFHGRLLLLLSLFVCNLAPPAYSTPSQKTIVVISGEDLFTPPFNTVYESFTRAMWDALNNNVTIYSENLDFVHFDSDLYKQRLNAWLRNKYAGRKIDAIVAFGSGALEFVVEFQPQIWPDVPVVFGAVTANSIKKLRLPQNVTGIVSDVRLEETVRLSKSVLPKVKRLALVGNSPERDASRPYFGPDLAALAQDMTFIDLRGKPLEEVQQRVARLPADAAVFFTSFTDDSTGRVFSSSGVLDSLVKIGNRPILIDNEAMVGDGAIGGMVTQPATRGRQVADYTQKVLAGKLPSELPDILAKTDPVFDWRQLKRWNVDMSLLPRGADVRFYQPGLWEENRGEIIAAVALVLLQSALVAALLIERHRRAVAVKEARQRLAEIAHMNRNAAANVYAAAITHELKQPLATIMSNAQAAELLLQREPPALDDVKVILGDIRRDDRRISDLIQRMRNTLKKSDPEIQTFDINEVIVKVLEFLASEARMRDVQLHADMAARQLPVSADRLQLKQVIINLVLNSMDAVSHMPLSKRVITIRSALADSRNAEVAVADSGAGFEPNVEQVFDSFFTTKPHGMGLGLSISAAIIHAYGGTINAANATSGGAVVRFRLPLQTRDTP